MPPTLRTSSCVIDNSTGTTCSKASDPFRYRSRYAIWTLRRCPGRTARSRRSACPSALACGDEPSSTVSCCAPPGTLEHERLGGDRPARRVHDVEQEVDVEALVGHFDHEPGLAAERHGPGRRRGGRRPRLRGRRPAPRCPRRGAPPTSISLTPPAAGIGKFCDSSDLPSSSVMHVHGASRRARSRTPRGPTRRSFTVCGCAAPCSSTGWPGDVVGQVAAHHPHRHGAVGRSPAGQRRSRHRAEVRHLRPRRARARPAAPAGRSDQSHRRRSEPGRASAYLAAHAAQPGSAHLQTARHAGVSLDATARTLAPSSLAPHCLQKRASPSFATPHAAQASTRPSAAPRRRRSGRGGLPCAADRRAPRLASRRALQVALDQPAIAVGLGVQLLHDADGPRAQPPHHLV